MIWRMTYDAERRLKYWQNGQNGQPITSQAYFMYGGSGNRVAQKVTTSGSTTTTYIAGGQEEVTSTGTTTTLTKYFSGPSGLPTAERVGTNGPCVCWQATGRAPSPSRSTTSLGYTSRVSGGPRHQRQRRRRSLQFQFEL